MLLRQNEARAVWEVSMLTVSEDQRSNSPHPLAQSEAFSLVVLKNRSFMYMYHQLWQGSTSSLVSILLAVSVEKPWAAVYGLLRKHAPFHPVHSPIWCFSSPPIPTPGSCFSLIFLLISPSSGYRRPPVGSPSQFLRKLHMKYFVDLSLSYYSYTLIEYLEKSWANEQQNIKMVKIKEEGWGMEISEEPQKVGDS